MMPKINREQKYNLGVGFWGHCHTSMMELLAIKLLKRSSVTVVWQYPEHTFNFCIPRYKFSNWISPTMLATGWFATFN